MILIIKSPSHFNRALKKIHIHLNQKGFKEFILQCKIVSLAVKFSIPNRESTKGLPMGFWVIGNGFSSYSSVAERETLCFHFSGPPKYFFSIAWFSPTFYCLIIDIRKQICFSKKMTMHFEKIHNHAQLLKNKKHLQV